MPSDFVYTGTAPKSNLRAVPTGRENNYWSDADANSVRSALLALSPGSSVPGSPYTQPSDVPAGTAALKGKAPDGASAVGIVLDNSTALVTAGAKILSLRTGGTEKAFVDKDGGIWAGSDIVPGAGLRFLARAASSAILSGQAADGASAVGIVFDNAAALSTAGAKLISLRNFGTEKAYFDLAGRLACKNVGKDSEFVSVTDYGADPTGGTDSTTAFTNALAASAKEVYVPGGSYAISGGGVTVPNGKSLIGAGAQASTLNYSGTGAAITINGCQGSRVENLKIVTSDASSTVRGIWMRNAGGSSQYNRIANCLVIQFNATARNAGQVGLLIEDDAATTLSQFWHHIENNRFLNWETSMRCLQSGTGADGVNQSFFVNNTCIANITGLWIGKGCGDHVVDGLFGSHSSVATFTDTVLVIGDTGGASPNSGGNICTGVVSDMGTNGKAFNVQTNSLNNYVVANNESSLADIDTGTGTFCISTKNLNGTNSRFRLPNLTILSSGSSFSGTILGGKVQQTNHRAAAALATTYSTSDRIVGHTGMTAAITDTLPASFVGGEHIVKDEDNSASATKTISVTCQAGETIDGVTTKVIINAAGGSARIYGIGGGKWFTW